MLPQVDFYFEHLHPLMPMLSETWVRHWLGLLWDEAGERVWRGWSSWSYDATDAESANLESRSPLVRSDPYELFQSLCQRR